VEEPIPGILVNLLKNAVASCCPDEYFRRQPKNSAKTVNAHGAEAQLRGHILQVDAWDGRKKIRTQPNNIKGRLIDPRDSLKEEWDFLSGPLVFPGYFDPAWNLRKGYDKSLMVGHPLRPEIAEAQLGLIGGRE
jgi:hypothetical protein